ncbi:MAG: glycosyltransferase family 4 protein [Candidatus Cloacimonetes bacterium]|nr:glycosyltransferase family 4 protein [Candidatus Cloacimonadota bacterium]
MKKIKIVHIQLLPILSGVQNVMLKILGSLELDKYDIYVISRPNGPLVEKVSEMEFTHIPLRSLHRRISLFDLAAFFQLIRIFRKYKFDIVHTHSSKPGFLGRISARLAGVPYIIHTVHGYPFHDYQNKITFHFYRLMEKFAAKFCDKVIFVNNYDRKEAIATMLVPSSKAVTIHNGIELPRYTKKIDLHKSELIIGSILRFWEQKNIINTIKMAIEVCRQNRNLKFVFVGDGELYPAAKKLVEMSGMSNKILLPGWVQDPAEWLMKFDVFLLYSRWEGLPLSILEAMSYGLPIIASDIKGNNELVNAETGLLVPINNLDRLTEVLLTITNDKEKLIEWGRNSRKVIKDKFTLSEFSDKYKKVYLRED